VLGIGAGWLIWEIATGERFTPWDLAMFPVELLLVSGAGAAMGVATRIDSGLRYKLTSWESCCGPRSC
jgi:hypothetical protein